MPLEPVAMYSADTTASVCHADTTAVDGCASHKETDPANKLLHADSLLSGPEVVYGSYNWEPVTQGKIDFLELFSGSNGLKVGTPIDLRTGFDILKVRVVRKPWRSLSAKSHQSFLWRLNVLLGVR